MDEKQFLQYTHTHLTALFPGSTQVSQYQKAKTNLDFSGARDIEWQWHQLGRMQACTLLQIDNQRLRKTVFTSYALSVAGRSASLKQLNILTMYAAVAHLCTVFRLNTA